MSVFDRRKDLDLAGKLGTPTRPEAVPSLADYVAAEATVVAPSATLAPPEKLHRLTHKSLDTYDEVLSTPLHHLPDRERKMFLSAKMRAARDVFYGRMRIDEQALKRQKLDALPKLLEEIRQAKAANPALTIAGRLK